MTLGLKHGSLAEYTCWNNYIRLSGNEQRLCVENGTWNGTALTCTYECGTPDAPANGNVSFDKTVTGEQANYSCAENYTLSGNETRVCTDGQGWNGSVPTCLKDCDTPDSGSYSNVTSTLGLKQGSLAEYTCLNNYTRVSGNEQRYCVENGLWNGTALSCTYDCGRPEALMNGNVTTTTMVEGGKATYTCMTGFTLIGEATGVCIDTEGWNISVPYCSPDCPEITNTGQGVKVNYSSRAYASVAKYSCYPGYQNVSGNISRICLRGGQWETTDIVCERIDCGQLNSVTNGSVSFTTTTFESTATYSCDSHYFISNGSQERECLADTSWSGTEPVCSLSDCGLFNSTPSLNINFTNGYFNGSVATFTCSPGYDISESYSLWCYDQSWNGTTPNCTIKDCGEPVGGQFSSVSHNGTTFGSVVNYTCNTNYSSETGNDVRYCTENGIWNGTALNCTYDCGDLSTPTNCRLELNSTVKDAAANYKAYPGYILNGSAERVCVESAGWNGTEPRCTPVNCGNPTSTDHTNVSTTDGTLFMSTATYECETGYVYLSGDLRRHCIEEGSWNGTELTCVYDCGVLNHPENGNVVFDKTVTGGIANYSCAITYTLFGNKSRVCVDGLGWFGLEPPTCLKDCVSPENGSYSKVTNTPELKQGSVAEYACRQNYTYLAGNEQRHCVEDGMWNGSALSCTYDCGNPDTPENGYLQVDKNVTGGRANYSCAFNYTLFGNDSRVCNDGLGWIGSVPSCLKDCELPDQGLYSNVTNTPELQKGSVAEYVCHQNYTYLSGNELRYCVENGQWNGSALNCIFECGVLNHPENGNVIVDRIVTGGIANYSCAVNYTLFGNKSRVCVDGLGWSGLAPPTCLKDCVSPDNGSYSKVINTPELKQGSVAEYACHQNYTYLAGNEQRYCVDNGQWNGSALSCTYDCGKPDTPENGYLQVDKNVTGGRANYSCALKYTLFGNESRVCNDILGWIGSVPSCLKDCELPNPGLYSYVTNTPELKQGSVAEYVCHQNYTFLSGNELRYCVENGQWNGSAINCTFDCGQPDNPDNGNVTTNTVVEGGQATYTCITGFTLIGEATGTCIDTEGWNVTVPYCSPDCPEITNLDQGVKVNYSSRAYASAANYSCYPGYQNVSENVYRICLQGGQWETGDFVCERVDCGLLNNVTNGSVSFTTTTFESTATYTCDSYYFISNGSQERECLADRSWSGTEPVCTLSDCDKFNATSNLNIHLTNGYFNGTIATFTCSPGYEISESYSLWCNDQSWNGTTPNCTIKDCGEPMGGQFSSVTHNGTTFSSVVNYTCDTNYTSETGNNVRFCTDNGIWNGTALNCIYECGDLTTPTNCRLELKSTVKGAAANYSAYPGYILNGSAERVCIENAGWNGAEPTCTPVNCGNPTSTNHTNVSTTGGTLFMSTATYECETGYVYFSGDLRRHCIEDGSWNGTELTCVYDCGGPESPDNGYVHMDKNITGGQANYSCAINYTLFGNESRICEDGLGWIGLAPTCKKDCLSPDQGLYSYVTNTPELKQGSVAEYACRQYYTYQSGNSQRYCIENGQWNGSALNCIFECGNLNDPENGNVIVDGNVTGGIANYSCAVNYTLFGIKSRVCEDGLGWFGLEPPTCLKDCMSPEDGSYSNVTNIPKLKQGSVAEYACHQNYTYLAGNDQRYCVQNGQWNGSALICTYDCGKPDTPENGYLQVDKNVTGGRANYSCAPNYTLFGNKSRVCEDGLGWIGSVPACLKDCEQPDQGLYSNVTNTQELKQGSVAEYACHQNYTYLAGNEQRYCVDNGQWNGSALNCTYECGNLVAPVNGNVSFDKNVTGGEAYYVCAVNYTLSSNAFRVCIDGQGWDGSAPTCRKDCGKLENITNGYVNMTTASYQSKATYGCDFGYFISSGSKERICLEGGEWSGSEPTCSLMDCDHIDTDSILLVNLSNGYFNDSIATFSCRPGYDLSEAYSLVCLNQMWNGTAPNCTKKDCRDPPAGINTNVITPQGTVFGSSAVFSCIANYIYVSGNIYMYCTEDGTWNGTSLSCVYDCLEPPNMEHGNVSLKGTVTGERANYTCDEGFSLDGNEFRVCIADEGWSGSQPSCRKDCDIPNNGTNSLVSNNPRLAQGSLAEYTCRPNYTRVGGDERRFCMENSQWNGSALNCAYDCRKPADLVNGNVQFKTPTVTNARVNYTCDNGFSLNGNVFRVCIADVGWNGSHPSCRKDCIQPENGSNSSVSNNPSLTQGSLVEYTCQPNYTRVGGDERRVCMENSQWNGSALNCAYVDCGRPPSVPNVRINVNATTIGSHANYTCDEGYDMPVGPIVKVCNSNGSWTENSIVCKPKKCGFVEKPIGGSILSAQNNTVGAVVRFGCRSGFDMQGSDTVKCLNSGQWSHPFPRCVANDDVVTTAIIAISVVTGALVVGGILGALGFTAIKMGCQSVGGAGVFS